MAWTWRFGVELGGKGLHPQQAAEVRFTDASSFLRELERVGLLEVLS